MDNYTLIRPTNKTVFTELPQFLNVYQLKKVTGPTLNSATIVPTSEMRTAVVLVLH